MKKLFVLILLFTSLCSFSQIEKPVTKGNFIISGGGTIESIHSKSEATEYSSFGIYFNPGSGYFVKDNLALGLTSIISYIKISDYKSYILGIGPFIKYYFSNGVFLNFDTFFDYTHGIGNTSQKITGISFAPGVGYAFFLNSKVSLEPSVNYKYIHSNTNDNIANDNDFFIALKLNIFL